MWWRRRREVGRGDLPAWVREEMARAQAEADRRASAAGAVFADVRANRRGRSTGEVAGELEARLAAEGGVWPREILMQIARNIAEPSWPLRHPIEFVRGIRANRGVGDEGLPEEPDPFEDQPTDDPEIDALVLFLRGYPGVRAVGYSSSAPDVVEVVLLPWSEAAADRVRDACSPREVRFVDDLPHWRDWNDRWS